MYKLFVLQGPRNEQKLQELYDTQDACHANFYELRDKLKKCNSKELHDIAVSVVSLYMDYKYNVTVHDDFQTNKSVARFIRDADCRGYEVIIIRLPNATGEILSWAEAWVN